MNDVRYVSYFTRHFRADLRDRLRMLAVQRSSVQRTSMEDLLNEALEVGLAVMERGDRVILLSTKGE